LLKPVRQRHSDTCPNEVRRHGIGRRLLPYNASHAGCSKANRVVEKAHVFP
jgi:hypothetical protein